MALHAQEALDLVRRPGGLDAEATTAVLDLLFSGAPSVEDGARILAEWAARGETGVELAALVTALRQRCVAVPTAADLDVCGTGGSGLVRYNVSTTVAFVCAAAGVRVAKHGNRGSARPNGSFDLLEALGIPFGHAPDAAAKLIDQHRLAFLFARVHHPAVGRVAPYRKAAGRRTLFNLAGPLANPCAGGVRGQVIGVTGEATAHTVAAALDALKAGPALIVWGHPNLDEISISGPTGWLFRAADGTTSAGKLDASLPAAKALGPAGLPGGDAGANAVIFPRVVAAETTGVHAGAPVEPVRLLRAMVVLNAGAAIDLLAGRPPAADGPGVATARRVLDSGEVAALVERYTATAKALATG